MLRIGDARALIAEASDPRLGTLLRSALQGLVWLELYRDPENGQTEKIPAAELRCRAIARLLRSEISLRDEKS